MSILTSLANRLFSQRVKKVPVKKEEWKVQFDTHTRNDIIAVCYILARNMNGALLSSDLKIFIGSAMHSGKSLVADSLIHSLSHDKGSTLNIEIQSNKMSMESKPFDAIKSLIHGDVTINKSKISVFFIRSLEKIRDVRKLSNPSQNSIIIFSRTGVKKQEDNYDLQIFMKSPHFGATDWSRKWEIVISSENLKTPDMSQSLDTLRSFNNNRQLRDKRILAPEIMTL